MLKKDLYMLLCQPIDMGIVILLRPMNRTVKYGKVILKQKNKHNGLCNL